MNTFSRGFPTVSAIARLAECPPLVAEPHWSFDEREALASRRRAASLRRAERERIRIIEIASQI